MYSFQAQVIQTEGGVLSRERDMLALTRMVLQVLRLLLLLLCSDPGAAFWQQGTSRSGPPRARPALQHLVPRRTSPKPLRGRRGERRPAPASAGQPCEAVGASGPSPRSGPAHAARRACAIDDSFCSHVLPSRAAVAQRRPHPRHLRPARHVTPVP